jgi:eukaryotic-like serine/threonine-protein kinase
MEPDRWQKIDTLFNDALQREPHERAAFLRESCVGDEAVRREIEALLAHQEKAAYFLESPAVEVAAKRIAAGKNRSKVGQQFGPYKILFQLGAGGMGAVYLAEDTRLDRKVAIKFLLPGSTADEQAEKRLIREAQAAARLEHPNICAIYEVGRLEDTSFIAMQYVEGETLASLIARQPLPLGRALDFSIQIADALDAAHSLGIIHRDIKPQNIITNSHGQIKVLDFGLAKVLREEGSLDDGRAIETGLSTPGMLMGTPAYMSPEQVRGETLDARSDIFSFGSVLYEMVSGQHLFAGSTTAETLAAILTTEPEPLARYLSNVPDELQRIVGKALNKDRKARYQGIKDLLIDLRELKRRGIDTRQESFSGTGARPAFRRTHRISMAIGIAFLLLAGLSGLFYSMRPAAAVTSPSEYTQITDFADSAIAPSLSPDGSMLTFIRGGEFFLSRGQIYVKLLPNGEAVPLTSDSKQKYAPVFTPDGSRIAYTTKAGRDWDTWTVSVFRSAPPARFLPNASGLTWMTDGMVLFSEIMTGVHMGIVAATEDRADSRAIYFPTHESAMAHYSYASPDRKSVLVVEMNQSHFFSQPCRLVPVDGSSAGRPVGPSGTCTSAAWSPDSKWMYFGARVAGSAHLWRQKFPDGPPEQITFGPTEEEGIALAPDGRSLVTSVGNRRSTIWIHEANGRERQISSEGSAVKPRLSRDGKRVFYLAVQDLVAGPTGWVPSSAELRSMDLDSGKSEKLLPGVSVADYDISPDEKEVLFSTSELGGKSTVSLASLDRRTPPQPVAAGDQASFAAGGDLIFRSLKGQDNFVQRIRKGQRIPEPLTGARILEKSGVSPDGEWVIAFLLDPIGTFAIPAHGGAAIKICASEHCPTMWSSDGAFIYVEISSGKTLAIPVPAGQSLPDLPPSGLSPVDDARGVRLIPHGSISPGADPSIYVFTKTDLQRNLFRIPLH